MYACSICSKRLLENDEKCVEHDLERRFIPVILFLASFLMAILS